VRMKRIHILGNADEVLGSIDQRCSTTYPTPVSALIYAAMHTPDTPPDRARPSATPRRNRTTFSKFLSDAATVFAPVRLIVFQHISPETSTRPLAAD
jgi:hypothetical protein